MVPNDQIRVLVVDDEPSIRQSLSAFLDDYDYDVTTAASAEEALETLENRPFDIAVVDLRLPGMSGDVLILKIHDRFPNIRFLIHTGSVNYRLSLELKAIGVLPDHVLLKPQPDLSCIVQGIQSLISDN